MKREVILTYWTEFQTWLNQNGEIFYRPESQTGEDIKWEQITEDSPDFFETGFIFISDYNLDVSKAYYDDKLETLEYNAMLGGGWVKWVEYLNEIQLNKPNTLAHYTPFPITRPNCFRIVD
jgi:hypothetical protein